MPLKLFGFSLGKKDSRVEQPPNNPALVLPNAAIEDGAVTITQGAHYGSYIDLEGSVRNELELISRYREMSLHPECSMAIEDIVSEALSQDTDGNIMSLNLEKLNVGSAIKKKIEDEFNTVYKLYNFKTLSDEMFRRWYIDGRIYFQIMVDKDNPKDGIQELRYIDPRKIRKVREILKDRNTAIDGGGILSNEVIKAVNEYFVFNDRGMVASTYTASVNQGMKIAADSIIYAPSGLLDAKSVMVIGHLHKAIKPLNQLRMIEDAVVIYRLSRAPERRVFYIDVGNLPKHKAEQYIQDIMVKYRNKLVYNAATGELEDQRRHLSMLEDFFLPRREGSKGTEISTLPPGQNLGQIEDVVYFRKKLYQSLNVPVSRMEDSQGGGLMGLGRTTEITRDEVKFFKFIQRLRKKFTVMFDEALKVQCSLKGICSKEEWLELKQNITYDFASDNQFFELRDADLLQSRIQLAASIDPFVGKYYSTAWVKRHVLQLTEDEIAQIDKEIQANGDTQASLAAQSQGAPMPGQPIDTGAAPQEPDQGGPTPDPEQEAAKENKSLTPDLDQEVEKYKKGLK